MGTVTSCAVKELKNLFPELPPLPLLRAQSGRLPHTLPPSGPRLQPATVCGQPPVPRDAATLNAAVHWLCDLLSSESHNRPASRWTWSR